MSTDNSTKFCNACGMNRPLDDFDTDLRSRDGQSYVCRPCYDRQFATKVCTVCGIKKSRDEFYLEKRAKSGLTPQCKECMQSRARQGYARANPAEKKIIREQTRNNQFKCRYGLNRIGYDRLFAEQEGRCVLCGAKPTGKTPKTQNLHIDHDHLSGHVRGLLCNRCNWALGTLGDNAAGILNVLDYLSRAEQAYRASFTAKPEEPKPEQPTAKESTPEEPRPEIPWPEPDARPAGQMSFDFE
jgi:hypothetical protein